MAPGLDEMICVHLPSVPVFASKTLLPSSSTSPSKATNPVVPCEKKFNRVMVDLALTILSRKSQTLLTSMLPLPATARKSGVLGNHLPAWICFSSLASFQVLGRGKLPTRFSSPCCAWPPEGAAEGAAFGVVGVSSGISSPTGPGGKPAPIRPESSPGASAGRVASAGPGRREAAITLPLSGADRGLQRCG